MKEVEAELIAYIQYECPYCEESDVYDIDTSDMERLYLPISITCYACEKEFQITKITD